jgi:NAD(P)-dependent dehydrogenase (short-subunit alcohol dehydrogenase family)
MSKVWLITGSGDGLGWDIAEAALAAGDSAVAGARRSLRTIRCTPIKYHFFISPSASLVL